MTDTTRERGWLWGPHAGMALVVALVPVVGVVILRIAAVS